MAPPTGEKALGYEISTDKPGTTITSTEKTTTITTTTKKTTATSRSSEKTISPSSDHAIAIMTARSGDKRPATEALDPVQPALTADVTEEEEEGEESARCTAPGDGAEGADKPAAATGVPPAKKQRDIAVSPRKYFEVFCLVGSQDTEEEVPGTKYGCSLCGRVYAHKKTVSKHWREKHGDASGDALFTPPGMRELLQQAEYTQSEHRRCCHHLLLEYITAKRIPVAPVASSSFSSSSHSHTQHNVLNVCRSIGGKSPLSVNNRSRSIRQPTPHNVCHDSGYQSPHNVINRGRSIRQQSPHNVCHDIGYQSPNNVINRGRSIRQQSPHNVCHDIGYQSPNNVINRGRSIRQRTPHNVCHSASRQSSHNVLNEQAIDEVDGAQPLSVLLSSIPLGTFLFGVTIPPPLFISAAQRQSIVRDAIRFCLPPIHTTLTPSLVASGRDRLMVVTAGSHWLSLRRLKLLTYRGTPVDRLRESGRRVWYLCVQCDAKYCSPARLRQHTLTVHRVPGLPSQFQCGHCGHSRQRIQEVFLHQETAHPTLLPDVTVLEQEEVAVHFHRQVKTAAGTSSCRVCPYQSESTEELERHYETYHGHLSFVCDHCPFISEVREEIVHHVDSNDGACTSPKPKGFTVIFDASSMPQISPSPFSMPQTSPSPFSMPQTSPSPFSMPQTSPSPFSMPQTSPSLLSMPQTCPSFFSMPQTSPSPFSMPQTSPSLFSMPQTSPSLFSMPQTSPSPFGMPQTSPSPSNMPRTSYHPSSTPRTSLSPASMPQTSHHPSSMPQTSHHPSSMPQTSHHPSSMPQTSHFPSLDVQPCFEELSPFSPPRASTPHLDCSHPALPDLFTEPSDTRSSHKDKEVEAVFPPVENASSRKENVGLGVNDDDDVVTGETDRMETPSSSQEKTTDEEEEMTGPKSATGDRSAVNAERVNEGGKPTRVYRCKHCPYVSISHCSFVLRQHCVTHRA